MKKFLSFCCLATFLIAIAYAPAAKAGTTEKAVKIESCYTAPDDALPPLLITTNCVTDDANWIPDAAKPAANISSSQVTTKGMTLVNNQASDKPSGKKAIMKWQKKNGLYPDGIWGPACKAKDAANKASKKAVALTDKDTGQDQAYNKETSLTPINTGTDSNMPNGEVAFTSRE